MVRHALEQAIKPIESILQEVSFWEYASIATEIGEQI
jgi:hypothetical protein